ncbi:hypothetical protein F5Y17DRAFT_461957 [Xylariaceae sp. FL0594]|nr:hypothetical protein F5Y17DRAFT_461957 [Xylariaceae sp. FL0594]
MQWSMVFHMSIVLLLQSFLTEVLAVPWYTDLGLGDPELAVHDKLVTRSTSTVIATVTVTAPTVVTTLFVSVTAGESLQTPSTMQATTSFQPASSMDSTGSEPTTIMYPTQPSAVSTLPPSSGPGTFISATTFATVTTPASPSPTSTFDTNKCDFKYCNAAGSSVCIYWEGYTSWDVSLGPIPGEQPTIIGTC